MTQTGEDFTKVTRSEMMDSIGLATCDGSSRARGSDAGETAGVTQW